MLVIDDYRPTVFKANGEPIPKGSIAIFTHDGEEIGRKLYTAALGVTPGDKLVFGGERRKIIRAEWSRGEYRIEMGR